MYRAAIVFRSEPTVKNRILRFVALALTGLSLSLQAADVMVVYDASNSMWGQIEGRHKIEIAREVMGQVMTEWDDDTQVGLVAYGHRREADCGDIETVIPVGSLDREGFMETVNGIVPRGKTPLTAAVRHAAEALNFRDRPATVVLISDGIESCNADPGNPVFPQKEPLVSVFTSLFLHGSIGHVLFNMWFLWLFGNNVEEAYGRIRYLFLYFLGGVAATAAFVFMNPDSTVPLVGASGAIAAVLGAYAVLFPGHRVLSLVGWFVIPVPAALFLGVWFLAQFGLGGTNVAWEAHAGGFVFGLVVTLPFRKSMLRGLR